MPPSKLTIKEQRMPDKAKPLSPNKKFLPDCIASFGISSIFTAVMALSLRELPLFQLISTPIIGLVAYLLTQKAYTGIKYGAEHRFLCTLLVKATIRKWPLRSVLYTLIKRLYSSLGKFTTYDDIAAFCYAIQFYEEESGLNEYGSIKKRVDLLKPFFPIDTPRNTLYKRFKKFELEGSSLMPGI